MIMASAADLNAETDARFWAGTSYKPGQKLSPNDPLDKPMIAVWTKMRANLAAQDKAGTLVLTYKHPAVAQPLAQAEAVAAVADSHEAQGEAAAHAGDAPAQAAHEEAAAVAAEAQDTLTTQAADAQAQVVSQTPTRGDWNITQYGQAADAMFRAMGAPSAVVTLGKNGDQPATQPFTDSAAASSAYDVVVEAPTDRWYVALYDRTKAASPNGRVDETYFGGVVPLVTRKRAVGAIVATTLAAGLAVFAGRKRKHRVT
jgi:hypothetical protein